MWRWIDKGGAVNMRSLDLKTTKHERVCLLFWCFQMTVGSGRPTARQYRLTFSPSFTDTFFEMLTILAGTGKQDEQCIQKQNPSFIIPLVFPTLLLGYASQLSAHLRIFKHDANSCAEDRQAISWLMVCAWALTEVCNNVLDHLLEMHWILKLANGH